MLETLHAVQYLWNLEAKGITVVSLVIMIIEIPCDNNRSREKHDLSKKFLKLIKKVSFESPTARRWTVYDENLQQSVCSNCDTHYLKGFESLLQLELF